MNAPPKLGQSSPADIREYVRVRDYYTGRTIYHADRLHDGWQDEIQAHLGYFADITLEETDDGFDMIRADGEPVAYIGDHPDLPMISQVREAAE